MFNTNKTKFQINTSVQAPRIDNILVFDQISSELQSFEIVLIGACRPDFYIDSIELLLATVVINPILQAISIIPSLIIEPGEGTLTQKGVEALRTPEKVPLKFAKVVKK